MIEESKKDIESLTTQHPADIADDLQRLPVDEAQDILKGLSLEQAAEVISELEEEVREQIVETFSTQRFSEILEELPPNEAADLIGAMEPDEQDRLLSSMEADQSAKVSNLLNYPEDTAGGIMTDQFISLRKDQTVEEAQRKLRGLSQDLDDQDVSYLYVTDSEKKLSGVVSLRDLVFRHPETMIGAIMNTEVRSVRVDADQEELAREFEHYHYLGLPVLEHDARLVGIVRANDIIEVAQEEATEDMQLMVGVSGMENTLTPWHKSIRHRLPWLFINLLTAFAAAAVISLFEPTIQSMPILAIFLPIIAGQGGNAGAQTLTIIIRDLALGEIIDEDGRKALRKEIILGMANGLAIGIVVGLIGYIWKGEPMIGAVAALAMLLNLIVAGMAGVLIPFGLKALRIDPALASSIFLTTVTDVAGFFIFLGLAWMAINTFALI